MSGATQVSPLTMVVTYLLSSFNTQVRNPLRNTLASFAKVCIDDRGIDRRGKSGEQLHVLRDQFWQVICQLGFPNGHLTVGQTCVPKWNPGKWNQRLNLRSPGGLILTHTHLMSRWKLTLAEKSRRSGASTYANLYSIIRKPKNNSLQLRLCAHQATNDHNAT